MKFAAIALGASLTASAAWADHTAPVEHMNANGFTFAATPAEGLSCDDISAVLSGLDESGYRAGPNPADPDDMAVLDYETALSVEYFTRCTLAKADTGAFASGFGAD